MVTDDISRAGVRRHEECNVFQKRKPSFSRSLCDWVTAKMLNHHLGDTH